MGFPDGTPANVGDIIDQGSYPCLLCLLHWQVCHLGSPFELYLNSFCFFFFFKKFFCLEN